MDQNTPAVSAGTPSSPERSQWSITARWIAAAVLVPLIALGVQDAVSKLARLLSPQTPNYTVQINDIEAVASKEGYRPILIRTADFRGPGEESYIVVFRHKTTDEENYYLLHPDQIRIYDESPTGRLHLSFLFQPERTPADRMSGETRVVDMLRLGDYANSGFPQALVSYADVGPGGPIYPRPLLIEWRPEQDKYRAYALTDRRPALAHEPHPSLYGREARPIYSTPAAFRDTQTGAAVTAYPAGDQMIVRSLDGNLYLVGGYVLRAYYANEFQRIQVQVTGVTFAYDRPYGAPCLSRVVDLSAQPTEDGARFGSLLAQSFARIASSLPARCPFQ